MTLVRRQLLSEAIQLALQNYSGKEIGFGTVPLPRPLLPYAILYEIGAGSGDGSWFDPEEQRDFLYQVTSIGTDPRQTAWMSDRIQTAFVGRGSSGEYSVQIPVAVGIEVYWRTVDGLGAILHGSEELWQVADTFRLKVGRTA